MVLSMGEVVGRVVLFCGQFGGRTLIGNMGLGCSNGGLERGEGGVEVGAIKARALLCINFGECN